MKIVTIFSLIFTMDRNEKKRCNRFLQNIYYIMKTPLYILKMREKIVTIFIVFCHFLHVKFHFGHKKWTSQK